MKLTSNVGTIDRTVRSIMGIGLIAAAYLEALTGNFAIAAYIVGAMLIGTAIIGFCPGNALIGLNTCKVKQ